MSKKRLRIFAGPNGSGKTTIINELVSKINFGVYVNADDIEKEIKGNSYLDLTPFKLSISTNHIQEFFKAKAFSPAKLNDNNLWQHLSIVDNKLYLTDKIINSYIAADIAEFIRQNLLASGISFAYETVMSHTNKLDFIQLAKDNGYRIYLYFIATKDPEINKRRVKIRMAQDGHEVKPEIIESRYYRSLGNLKVAVKLTNRAYIFDNSEQVNKLLAEITEGNDVKIFDENQIPDWFIKYLVD